MKIYNINWEIIVSESSYIKRGKRKIVDLYVSNTALIVGASVSRPGFYRIVGEEEVVGRSLWEFPGILMKKYQSLGEEWNIRIFRNSSLRAVPVINNESLSICFACFEVDTENTEALLS